MPLKRGSTYVTSPRRTFYRRNRRNSDSRAGRTRARHCLAAQCTGPGHSPRTRLENTYLGKSYVTNSLKAFQQDGYYINVDATTNFYF